MRDIYTYAYVNRDVVLRPKHQRHALAPGVGGAVDSIIRGTGTGSASRIPLDAFKREDE